MFSQILDRKICSHEPIPNLDKNDKERQDISNEKLIDLKECLKNVCKNPSEFEFQKISSSEWICLSNDLFPSIREGKDLALSFQWLFFLFRHLDIKSNCYVHGETLGYSLATHAPTYFHRLFQAKITSIPEKTKHLQFIFEFQMEDIKKKEEILECFRESLEIKQHKTVEEDSQKVTLYFKNPSIVIMLIFGKYRPTFVSEDCVLDLNQFLQHQGLVGKELSLKPHSITGLGSKGLIFSALEILAIIESKSWNDPFVTLKTLEAMASGYHFETFPPHFLCIPNESIQSWLDGWTFTDPQFAFSLFLHTKIYLSNACVKLKNSPIQGLYPDPFFISIEMLEKHQEINLVPLWFELCVFLSLITTPDRVKYVDTKLHYYGNFCLTVPLFTPQKGAELVKKIPKEHYETLLPVLSQFIPFLLLDQSKNTFPHWMKGWVHSLVYIFLDSGHPLLNFISLYLHSMINSQSMQTSSFLLFCAPVILRLAQKDPELFLDFKNEIDNYIPLHRQTEFLETHQGVVLALLDQNKYYLASSVISHICRSKLPIFDQSKWIDVLINLNKHLRNKISTLSEIYVIKLYIKIISSSDKISQAFFDLTIDIISQLTQTNLKESRKIFDQLNTHQHLDLNQKEELIKLKQVYSYQEALNAFNQALSLDVNSSKRLLINDLVPNKSFPFNQKEKLVRMLIRHDLTTLKDVDISLLEEWIDLIGSQIEILLKNSDVEDVFFSAIETASKFLITNSKLKAKLSKHLFAICRFIEKRGTTEKDFTFIWQMYINGITLPEGKTTSSFFINILSHAIASKRHSLNTIYQIYRDVCKSSLGAYLQYSPKHLDFLHALVDRAINEEAFTQVYFDYLSHLQFNKELTIKAIQCCHKKQSYKMVVSLVHHLCVKDISFREELFSILITNLHQLQKLNDPALPQFMLMMNWLNDLEPKSLELISSFILTVVFDLLKTMNSSTVVNTASDLFIQFASLIKQKEESKQVSISLCHALIKIKDTKKLFSIYSQAIKHFIFKEGDQEIESLFQAIALTFSKKQASDFFKLVSKKNVILPSSDENQIRPFLKIWSSVLKRGCLFLYSLPNLQKMNAIKMMDDKLIEIQKILSNMFAHSVALTFEYQKLSELYKNHALAFHASKHLLINNEQGLKTLAKEGLIYTVTPNHRYFEQVDKIIVQLLGVLLSSTTQSIHATGVLKLTEFLKKIHRPVIWKSCLPLLNGLLKKPLSKPIYESIVQISPCILFHDQTKFPLTELVHYLIDQKVNRPAAALCAAKLLLLGWGEKLIEEDSKFLPHIYKILEIFFSKKIKNPPNTIIFQCMQMICSLADDPIINKTQIKIVAQIKYFNYLCKYLCLDKTTIYSASLMESINDAPIVLSNFYQCRHQDDYHALFNSYLDFLRKSGKEEGEVLSTYSIHTMRLLKMIFKSEDGPDKERMLKKFTHFILLAVDSAQGKHKRAHLSWASYLASYMNVSNFGQQMIKHALRFDLLKRKAKSCKFTEFDRLEPIDGYLFKLAQFENHGEEALNYFLNCKEIPHEKILDPLFKIVNEILLSYESFPPFGGYIFRKLGSLIIPLSQEQRVFFVNQIFIRLLPKNIQKISARSYFSKLFGGLLVDLFTPNSKLIYQCVIQNLYKLIEADVIMAHPIFIYSYCFYYLSEVGDDTHLLELEKLMKTHENRITQKSRISLPNYHKVVIDRWYSHRNLPLPSVNEVKNIPDEHLSALIAITDTPVRSWLWKTAD
ncbi:MAG: hypothetical protein KDK55_02055 [Chlamydiia bacterium]|nr:hypothetical protein [Chlamydiia bacterium]